MKPRDDLFMLIQALDKNERRYFSLYCEARHLKNGAKFQQLFAAIAKQEVYDEAALKTALAGHPWVKNLSAEKAALYQGILEAMQSYHGPTERERIHELLRQARFLRGKGLNAQVERCLEQAAVLVQQHDALAEDLMLQDLRRRLLKEQLVKGRAEELQLSWQQSRRALESLMQVTRLREIFDHFFHLARQKFVLRSAAEREELETWMADALLQPDVELHAFQAVTSRNGIFAIYHQLRAEPQQAHLWFAQNRKHWEAHPKRIASSATGYLTTMANYLHSCCLIGDYEAIPEAVACLQALALRNWDEEAERFQNCYYYLLLDHLNHFDVDASLAMVPDIKAGLAKYSAKINRARVLGFHYNIAIAYFMAEQFRDAKRWFQQALDGPESENRIDIRQTARMMLLICHMELQDDALFESVYLSAYRHLQRHDRLLAAERMVFTHLQAIAHARDRAQRQAVLEIFLGELIHLQRDPEAALPPGIQEITYWVRSRLVQKPLVDVARHISPLIQPHSL